MNKYLVTKKFIGNVISPQHPDGYEVTFHPGENMYGVMDSDNVLLLNKTNIIGVEGNLHKESL